MACDVSPVAMFLLLRGGPVKKITLYKHGGKEGLNLFGPCLISTKTFSLFNLEYYSSLNSKGMNLTNREYRPTAPASSHLI